MRKLRTSTYISPRDLAVWILWIDPVDVKPQRIGENFVAPHIPVRDASERDDGTRRETRSESAWPGASEALSASSAADGRLPHQQPRPRRWPAVFVADFCNKICHKQTPQPVLFLPSCYCNRRVSD
jgi:hypothetical protein